MGILNSIWTFLITPNEYHVRLSMIPCTFIEAFIGSTVFLTILNISTTKNNNFLYVLSSSLINIISSFLIPNPFNVFINYVLYFILIIIIFKTSPFKALISVATPIAMFGLISTLILNPYLTMLNITTEQLSNIPFYNYGYLLFLYSISFVLILILKIRNLKINLFEDIDKKSKHTIFFNFILGIITLIVQALITFYYIDNLPILITFLSFISLLAYFGISIYSLTRVLKLNTTTKKLESAEEYNKTLHILHDNVRGFKHDFDNIVTTIGGYIRTSDMEGLQHYYLQLEDDCQRVNNLYLLNPEIINNPRYL